jgi:uridylate kinase
MKPLYKRIILKISGEALAGEKSTGLNFEVMNAVADQLIQVANMGVEIGIIVGGGNIWRGRSGVGMDRTTADYMGMLATVINALAMQDALENKNMSTRVQTAIEMRQIAEPYIRRRAMRHLEKGRIVIFACGTGNPYFSTDTAAALRAAEIEADLLLLAKNVDGVYDSDPHANQNAKKYDFISYIDVINQGLTVMDTTAISLCMDNRIPIIVFGVNEKDGIKRVVCGESIGTRINTKPLEID